jgi:uncharacterized protein YjbJ (UPF0337 family)
MNTETVIANWNVLQGKMKAKFAQLTDNDLLYVEGKEDELYGRISARIGQAKDKVKEMVAAL